MIKAYFKIPCPKVLLGTSLICCMLPGCDVEHQKDLKGWKPAFSGPIAHGRINAGAIINQQNIKLQHTLAPEEWLAFLKQQKATKPIVKEFGPVAFLQSTFVQKLIGDKGAFDLKLSNTLPVDLLAGSELVLKNPEKPEIVWSKKLKSDLKAGDTLQIELPTFPAFDLGKQFHAFYLKPFKMGTIPESLPVSENGFGTLDFSFQLGTMGFDVALINQPSALGFKSSSSLDMNLGQLNQAPVEGTFHFTLHNHLPLKLRMQAYLVGNDGQIQDSLFRNPALIKPAKVNQNGLTMASQESEFEVQLEEQFIEVAKVAEGLRLDFHAIAQVKDRQISMKGSDYLDFNIKGQFQVRQ